MRYTAKVIPGRGAGRRIGFPTINVQEPEGLAASHGIYAGWVWLDPDQSPLPTAIHYGPAPTFHIEKPSLEIHVINQEITKVPEQIYIELVERIRDVQDFDSAEALARQISQDIQKSLKILTK